MGRRARTTRKYLPVAFRRERAEKTKFYQSLQNPHTECNPRKRLLAHAYLETGSVTESGKRAGYFSPSTAHVALNSEACLNYMEKLVADVNNKYVLSLAWRLRKIKLVADYHIPDDLNTNPEYREKNMNTHNGLAAIDMMNKMEIDGVGYAAKKSEIDATVMEKSEVAQTLAKKYEKEF